MSGARPVDWIYVDDVAAGIIALLKAGPVDGSPVDIGTGRLVTTGDVASMICDIAGNDVAPTFGAVPDRASEQVRKADTARTSALIDWEPAIPVEEGLRRTLEWYKHNHNP